MNRRPRKSLNADINLTPFIDMLSTCVCFLLISAVWVQVGSLEIKQSHGTEAAQTTKKTYELNMKFESAQKLVVDIKKGNRRAKRFKITDKDSEALLAKFDGELKQWLAKNSVTISQALIKPTTKLTYEYLVKALDILRGQNITNLGITSGVGR